MKIKNRIGLKKLKIGLTDELTILLLDEPTILFLSIYPKETKILAQKHMYTPMFTAVLFIIDKM